MGHAGAADTEGTLRGDGVSPRLPQKLDAHGARAPTEPVCPERRRSREGPRGPSTMALGAGAPGDWGPAVPRSVAPPGGHVHRCGIAHNR